MKVLFCIHTPKNANTAVFGIYQSKKAYAEKKGWRAEVLAPEDFPEANLVGRRIYLLYPFYVMLYLLKMKDPYTLVIFHSYSGWVFNFSKLFIPKLRKTKVVTTFHGVEALFIERMIREYQAAGRPLHWYFKWFHGRFLNWLIKWSCRLSDAVFCLNKTEREYLISQHYQKAEKISLLSNEADEFFRITNRVYRPRIKRLLFVGPWLITKGTRYLVDAFSELAKENPDLELVISGTFTPVEEVRKSLPTELHHRISIYPEIEHTKILDFYRDADVYISPSLSEGASCSLIEALMTGIPVITTEAGTAPEFLEHKKSAWFISFSNSHAIVEAVRQLDQAPGLRESMGKEGQKRVSEFYATERVWEEWAVKCMEVHGKVRKPLTEQKLNALFVVHTPKNMNTAVYRGYHTKKAFFERMGWSVDILTPQDLSSAKLDGRRVYLWYPFWVFIWLLSSEKKYDIILFHSFAGWLFNLFHKLFSKFKKITSITAFHGVEPLFIKTMIEEYESAGKPLHWYFKLYHGWFLNGLIWLSCRFSDAVFCLNKREFNYLVETGHQSRENVFIMENEVSMNFNVKRTYAPRAKKLLFVGQWLLTKGTRYLVNAYKKIAAADPEIHLTLAGTLKEPAEVFKDWPENLANRVTVIPQLGREDMIRQYEQADLFIFPSLSEAFARSLAEAMMTGLPVITTPNGVVPDYFQHNRDVWMVPFSDAEALADAIEKLKDDASLRSRLGTQAHRIVQDRFIMEITLKKWMDQCLRLHQRQIS